MTSEEMVKLAQLEGRVDELEKADKKHMEFRREYYQDREERIRRDAKLDSKLDNLCADVKALLAWREIQVGKPAKRWESIFDIVIKVAMTAVLAKIGLA